MLRTDDTDSIFSSLPSLQLCSFPCSPILPFFPQSCPSSSSSLFALYPSAWRERASLAQGITRRTDRRFFSPASPDILWSSHKWSFYESSYGNFSMLNRQAVWWTCSLREVEWDQACLLSEVFNTSLFRVALDVPTLPTCPVVNFLWCKESEWQFM